MKVGITIPIFISTPELLDLYKQTLLSIVSNEHELIYYPVVNKLANRLELPNIPRFLNHDFWVNDINAVSIAWNRGIARLFTVEKCDYVLVMNQDVKLESDTIDKLVKLAEDNPDNLLYSAVNINEDNKLDIKFYENGLTDVVDFSCFMIKPEIINIIGWFDEKIRPAYFEDTDYQYRMLKQGITPLASKDIPYFHHGSQTVKYDKMHAYMINKFYTLNRLYFNDKHNLKPGDAWYREA